MYGPNQDEFSTKVDEFYSVFENKIRKEIIKNRKSEYFVLYNQDIIDIFNMHDYRQFNYEINTNIVVINVNNVKYLTIILNNIDDFKVNTKQIHNIKLIKYFYKNFENSLVINQLNNETNFLVNSNISLIEYLGKISSHLPGFIYQFKMSPDGTFSIPFASEKIYEVFGVTQKQVYDNPNLVFEIIHPEDADRCKFAIMESANNLTTWK